MPGGLGQGTENLTGVLEATVHDPARSGPGVRLAHGITPPREDVDVGRQPDPNFHACKASPEGTKRLARTYVILNGRWSCDLRFWRFGRCLCVYLVGRVMVS